MIPEGHQVGGRRWQQNEKEGFKRKAWLMRGFMPSKERAGVLGEGESMGKKTRSLGEVVSPGHHIWTCVDKGSSSLSSLLYWRLIVLCLGLIVP